MRHLFNLNTLIPAATGFLFGVVANLLTEAVLEGGSIYVNGILIAAALTVLSTARLQTPLTFVRRPSA